MEREACVCDHGFERSDLCAEMIIIIIIIIIMYPFFSCLQTGGSTRVQSSPKENDYDSLVLVDVRTAVHGTSVPGVYHR